MNLYIAEDDDRTLYIVAKTFEESLAKWRALMRLENDCDDLDGDELLNPHSIALVADSYELLIDPANFDGKIVWPKEEAL